MAQLQSFLGSDQSGTDATLEGLKAKFTSVKAQIEKVPEADRFVIVNTKLMVGCGCGGSYTPVHIVIPNDNNAEHIRTMLEAKTYNEKIDIDEVSKIQNLYPGIIVNEGHFSGNASNYDPSQYDNYM